MRDLHQDAAAPPWPDLALRDIGPKCNRRWLPGLVFAAPAHEEILQRIEGAEALCDRLKAAILELVPQWSLPPVVEASRALRRLSLIVASVIVAEVGTSVGSTARPN